MVVPLFSIELTLAVLCEQIKSGQGGMLMTYEEYCEMFEKGYDDTRR